MQSTLEAILMTVNIIYFLEQKHVVDKENIFFLLNH
jgi:hypothetical protein